MQILESEVAERLTFLKTGKVSFGLYLNSMSDIANTGGFNGSTSGNFSLTSTSFSTGFNSGLNSNSVLTKSNIDIFRKNLQFFQHFDFWLYRSGTICIVTETINKLLDMLSMGHLGFVFTSLGLQLFVFGLLKLFVVASRKDKRKLL